ncbi:hypothetical protein SHIRM173S_02403 [Streptomyces hirsutus]
MSRGLRFPGSAETCPGQGQIFRLVPRSVRSAVRDPETLRREAARCRQGLLASCSSCCTYFAGRRQAQPLRPVEVLSGPRGRRAPCGPFVSSTDAPGPLGQLFLRQGGQTAQAAQGPCQFFVCHAATVAATTGRNHRRPVQQPSWPQSTSLLKKQTPRPDTTMSERPSNSPNRRRHAKSADVKHQAQLVLFMLCPGGIRCRFLGVCQCVHVATGCGTPAFRTIVAVTGPGQHMFRPISTNPGLRPE